MVQFHYSPWPNLDKHALQLSVEDPRDQSFANCGIQILQERDALKGIFESFQNNVKAPITAFAAMTEQARQVFEHDASIPLASKALRDTDRNLALQNGQ